MESLSTVGGAIGAASAISTHGNAPAAAAPANAAELFRKSRRLRPLPIAVSLASRALRPRGHASFIHPRRLYAVARPPSSGARRRKGTGGPIRDVMTIYVSLIEVGVPR